MEVLDRVTDSYFFDHALWRMVPEMAKTDKTKAQEMADRIRNSDTRVKAIQSIETGQRIP